MDNLANNWGCTLYGLTSRELRTKTYEKADETIFKSLVKQNVGDAFMVRKFTSSGSDANLFAVCDATNSNTDCCLVACGSYVSGDDGPLQSWSTSLFDVANGPASITRPSKVQASFTRFHTIGLPYHIPNHELDSSTIELFENECLMELHIRCLQAKMRNAPYKALLMELILAANGALLSNRALEKLGALAKHHRFAIVVDEIMTSARTGHFLLSSTKPTIFRNQVSHVTLGKWLGLGLVLVARSFSRESLSHMGSRGASTGICCKEANLMMRGVVNNLPQVNVRRTKVLSKLRVKEADAWGCGALIFAPICRTDIAPGTKNRFLPQLAVDLPVDSIPVKKKPEWSKVNVNADIMEGVKAWVSFHPCFDDRDKENRMVTEWLLTCKPDQWLTTANMREVFKDGTTASTSQALRRAESAGMLSKQIKTKKRLRFWVVQDFAIPPWIKSNSVECPSSSSVHLRPKEL